MLSFFLNGLIVQLLMSIASLPFLLWWHIPYPLLSILGNLINPCFLTAFLFLTSAIFFATLLGIPHTPLTTLLITITNIWDHLLDAPIPSGWIALHWWYLIPAYSIAILIFCSLIYTTKHRYSKKIIWLLIVVNGATGLWQLHAHKEPGLTILRKGDHALVCIPLDNGSIEVVDHGYLRSARDTKAAVYYDLIPHVLFTYGMPTKVVVRGDGKRISTAQAIIQNYLRC